MYRNIENQSSEMLKLRMIKIPKIFSISRKSIQQIVNRYCAYFKNTTRYSDKLFQNLKRRAVSWDQLFSVHFFCQKYEKNSAATQ